jgi:drug/metabolite transporter (DMT)-like permease
LITFADRTELELVMARRFLIVGSFTAIYLLWGSTYFAIALGLKTIPPFMLMGVRSLCGGLVLIALSGRELIHLSRRTWLNAGLCGLLFFVGCHGVLASAQQTVPSGIAAIVLATIPFWILLIDFVVPARDRPSRYILIALVPGFVGVAIVAWQNVANAGVSIVPIVWLLGAAFSWSSGTVLSRRTSSDGSSVLISGIQLSLGGVVLFVISFLAGEMQQFSPRAVSVGSLEAAAYLIVSGSAIGFAAYHWLLDNVQTSLVSTYTFINPIVAVLLGTMILGEPFSASIAVGTCLVIVSIIGIWVAEHSPAISRKQGTSRPRRAREISA